MGLGMAFNQTFRAIVKPLFDMFKPMPPLAWISIAILWFGIGESPKIFIIVIGSFVPVVLNSFASVQLIEPELFDVVRMIGGKRKHEIRYVCAPGALPAITAGLQIAMSSAWTCVVAAEMVNSRSGLGYTIIQGMKFSDPGIIIGGMLIITAASLVFTQGMEYLTRRLTPWQREVRDY
jgi:ABC-type nitrate/sulfonate/bicarbonate transport system permease component